MRLILKKKYISMFGFKKKNNVFLAIWNSWIICDMILKDIKITKKENELQEYPKLLNKWQ